MPIEKKKIAAFCFKAAPPDTKAIRFLPKIFLIFFLMVKSIIKSKNLSFTFRLSFLYFLFPSIKFFSNKYLIILFFDLIEFEIFFNNTSYSLGTATMRVGLTNCRSFNNWSLLFEK